MRVIVRAPVTITSHPLAQLPSELLFEGCVDEDVRGDNNSWLAMLTEVQSLPKSESSSSGSGGNGGCAAAPAAGARGATCVLNNVTMAAQ